MPVERSAGIIFFLNTPEGRRYLVIRSSHQNPQIGKSKKVKEFWDFPKGRLEGKETGLDAAKREAREEAGIKEFTIFPKFKETVHYFTWRDKKPIPKFVAMFLADAKSDTVKLSWEHDTYEWLPYSEAHDRLTLSQMKKALLAAEDFLKK